MHLLNILKPTFFGTFISFTAYDHQQLLAEMCIIILLVVVCMTVLDPLTFKTLMSMSCLLSKITQDTFNSITLYGMAYSF